jgi:hypothetical protein
MRPQAFASLLLLVPSVLQAQQSAAPACECERTLAFVADYVERNYAGFPDKVTPATRPAYRRLRAELSGQAREARTDAACHPVLARYVEFFRDRHLSVSFENSSSGGAGGAAAIRARFADWPSRPLPEAEVRAYLDRHRDDLAPPEGIWEAVGADYRLAVLRSPEGEGRYDAVVLRADSVWWTPGQVKAKLRRTAPGEYATEFYMRDHTPRATAARARSGLLLFADLGPWARVYPGNTAGYDPERYRASRNAEFGVRELDPQTALIQLPSFNGRHATKVDSLIRAHRELLTRTPNLIIDVRGNGGGADLTFQPLRPLLYTAPMVTPGLSIYATEDNIRQAEKLLSQPGFPEEWKGRVRSMVAEMRERPGKFLPAPDDTFRLAAVLPNPRRVAVLTDRFCASSCESFVWNALQSDKVTVYGENTGGLLDYGNVTTVETPCPAFRLRNPTARSTRVDTQPLDLVGITPEVRIPEGVVYPLEWVHQHLKEQSGTAP